MGSEDFTVNQDQRHPNLWFEDGNVLVHLEDGKVCKVHRNLLERISPKSREPSQSIAGETDWEPLLEHIYKVKPLGDKSPFQTLSSILSISHEDAADFPDVHKLAQEQISRRYPSEPRPLDYGSWTNVEDATKLCLKYGPKETLKPLFYALITHSDGDVEEESPLSVTQLDNLTDAQLDATIAKRCANGLRRIMEHFSPMLFTPPPASHMECTDKIADHWMPLVLQPAINNGGMYKPLEMLKTMREVDWEGVGVCKNCAEEKRKEWIEEADVVWEKLGSWLDL